MFKWLKKQYKRYKLNNKFVLIQNEIQFNEITILQYFPGKNIVKNAHVKYKYDSLSERVKHVVINYDRKIVYIEKFSNIGAFKEANENLTKDILNAYDRYIEELQELEML
jgi:hypothetical protein